MPNYQRLYTTLFNRVEDVMTYINDAIVLKEAYRSEERRVGKEC